MRAAVDLAPKKSAPPRAAVAPPKAIQVNTRTPATGGAARDPSAFAVEELHTAGGAGLRFALTPGDRLNFRVDYGVGRASSALYITLGESF